MKRRWAWDHVELTEAEVYAVKALRAGRADETQQRLAYETIVEKICAVNALSFAHGGEEGRRATDFAEGKRWCGRTIELVADRQLPRPASGRPPIDK